jgi:hypothetical protein
MLTRLESTAIFTGLRIKTLKERLYAGFLWIDVVVAYETIVARTFWIYRPLSIIERGGVSGVVRL